MIHEFLGLASDGEPASGGPALRPGSWLPPLSVIIHLARRAILADGAASVRPVLWIGPETFWPYPPALMPARSAGPPDLLSRSIFIRARTPAERAWAIDLCLRSPAACAVIADASAMRMADSRRFQLAAARGGALALLIRPPWELTQLSAARTRWLVASAPSPGPPSVPEPRWTVHLLRCKGVQPATEARRWTLGREHETGALHLVPDAPGRGAAAEGPAALTG